MLTSIHTAPIALRCLALTGSFETSAPPPGCFSGLCGDFDGQGLSFGALQWNFGSKTLQPLFEDMLKLHPAIAASIFGSRLAALQKALAAPFDQQIRFAHSIQNASRKRVVDPWLTLLKTLGATPEFQAIQVQHASRYFNKAVSSCHEYELTSERGLALMFDIRVQNGSIGPATRLKIVNDFIKLQPETEVQRMTIIAKRRASAAKFRFTQDVLKRKLCIAEGKGIVHGIAYDLQQQFGITLDPLPSGHLRDASWPLPLVALPPTHQ